MSRIRTIKPEFWKHEELSALPEATHMLAAALLNYADDDGFFNANPLLIKAECFPLREPSVSVPVSLQELSRMGWIRLGSAANGKRYGQIVKFSEHQVISHKRPSKFNDVGLVWDASSTPPVTVHPEWNGMEGNGKGSSEEEKSSSGAIAPTEEDFDARKDLFGPGLAELACMTGKPSGSCRSLLGKWLKQTEDDAGEVRRTIRRAVENRVAEPIAWIEKSLKAKDRNDPYRGSI
jgi:hypothetical protein